MFLNDGFQFRVNYKGQSLSIFPHFTKTDSFIVSLQKLGGSFPLSLNRKQDTSNVQILCLDLVEALKGNLLRCDLIASRDQILDTEFNLRLQENLYLVFTLDLL
jgi:hypothetical protein